MFKYFIPVDIYNNENRDRKNEPVKIDLYFDIFKPNENGINIKDEDGKEISFQVFNCIKKNDKLIFASIYILCTFNFQEKKKTFNILLSEQNVKKNNLDGIKKLPTTLADGFVNLDTKLIEIIIDKKSSKETIKIYITANVIFIPDFRSWTT